MQFQYAIVYNFNLCIIDKVAPIIIAVIIASCFSNHIYTYIATDSSLSKTNTVSLSVHIIMAVAKTMESTKVQTLAAL